MSPSEITLNVKGMTCNHCAMSVKEVVEPLTGVDGVAVSVQEGTMTVATVGPADRDAIANAVRGAGYEVAL